MDPWADRILDSHCHLYELGRFKYPWPTPDLTAIFKDHRVEDLWAAMEPSPAREVVFVQCLNDSPEEAKWVMSLAKQHPRIKGIVAGLDPSHQQFESQLTALKSEVPLLVGVRHILDLEPRPNYLELEEVAAGVRALHRHDMTFDLLLSSSMVTEADCEKWKPEDLRPYVEHMIAVFGCDRLMYGSDWPVCRLARADYDTVFSTLRGLLSHLPEQQLEKIFCNNARNFYKV
ncbi:uncharacterized protein LOC125044325 isoform X3 [Penaeus chinensis]|uniref:uncharacterized protein LOC125044325 isoform X3 n=1 Tax=Penaeus chinensis TaxID=139456 RepID=UPI001FB76D12|nr:uncharacterized protein LOC125044325 isoform X3 [Penaeus chinensis]